MKLGIYIALDIQPYAKQSLYWFIIPCSHVWGKQPSRSHIKGEEIKPQPAAREPHLLGVTSWLIWLSMEQQAAGQKNVTRRLHRVHQENESLLNAYDALGPARELFWSPCQWGLSRGHPKKQSSKPEASVLIEREQVKWGHREILRGLSSASLSMTNSTTCPEPQTHRKRKKKNSSSEKETQKNEEQETPRSQGREARSVHTVIVSRVWEVNGPTGHDRYLFQ